MQEYGICIWNIVPVRSNPSDKEELCTQLLFGDRYQLLEKADDGKWFKIKVDFDGYEGWIDFKQHYELTEVQYHKLVEAKSSVVLSLGSKALFAEKDIPLLPGSTLPHFLHENQFRIGQYDWGFIGEAGLLSRSEVITKALAYLGTPYLWGGKTHFGIDCSGFVQMVFKQCGVNLPRDAYQQAEIGEIILLNNAKEGDLAFFSNDKGRVTHVGIVLKGMKIIHAHGEVRIDVLDENGIFNSDRNTYSHKLSSITKLI